MDENISLESVNCDTVLGEHASAVGFGGNEGRILLRLGISKEEDVPESRVVNLSS